MRVLGLVANSHDSGAALLSNGKPVFVLEEERFNRQKHTQQFPALALAAGFKFANIKLADIDVISTPWDVRRLRRTVLKTIARGFPHSLNLLHSRAHPAQRNQIVMLNQYLARGLKAQFNTATLPPIVNVGHHDSHAAAYFVSPFDEALVLVMDGYGDDAASSAYLGRGNRLKRIWSTDAMNSLGLVYTFVTEHLGFTGFGDEGKVMALAAFGSDALVERFRDVVALTPDGSYRVNMDYFSYPVYGQLRPTKPKFAQTFGPSRRPGEPLTDHHRDLACALQKITEETILHVVRHLLQCYPVRNVILTGGVALNCVANARVLAEAGTERLWVPPFASDAGAPLGAALWHTHQTLARPRDYELTSPYLGLAYSDIEIEHALKTAGLSYQRFSDAALVGQTAKDLAAGRIVGWYQGRFEIGPRALGNRSILADPRSNAMRDRINAVIKKRESFRPFAPAIPVECASEFFEITQPDPFMTLAPHVRPDKRDQIAAAVHVDGTGRIQTVDAATNPRYHALLVEFGRLTGVPILINTSFNEQEPIVTTPAEAIACFLRTEMDTLVLGNCHVTRAALSMLRPHVSNIVRPARHAVTSDTSRRALGATGATS